MEGARHPCSWPLILGSVDYKMLLRGYGLGKMLTICTVAVSIASLVHGVSHWFDIVSALRSLKSEGKTLWPCEIQAFQGRHCKGDCESVNRCILFNISKQGAGRETEVNNRSRGGREQKSPNCCQLDSSLICRYGILCIFVSFLAWSNLSENTFPAFI